jgi:hypothetical protein
VTIKPRTIATSTVRSHADVGLRNSTPLWASIQKCPLRAVAGYPLLSDRVNQTVWNQSVEVARPELRKADSRPTRDDMRRTIIETVLGVVVLVAAWLWLGNPGPFFALIVARILWSKYLVNDGD